MEFDPARKTSRVGVREVRAGEKNVESLLANVRGVVAVVVDVAAGDIRLCRECRSGQKWKQVDDMATNWLHHACIGHVSYRLATIGWRLKSK